MNVAIIGAGISGLSCAVELQRHGIIPVIFEKKSSSGYSMNFFSVILKMFHRTKDNPIDFISSKYGLQINPHSKVKKIIMEGPNRSFSAKGNHGYVFKRGEDADSLENQIAKNLSVTILNNNDVDIDDIKDSFDYIVVATGDDKIAKKLNVWNARFAAHSRIATVLGSFDVNTINMWIDTKYAKNGFCFMVPETEKKAYISLTINEITFSEIDHYWGEFLRTRDLPYQVIETCDREDVVGFCKPVKIDNVIFTGNTAGVIDSTFGFGTLNAIESGFLAARSIINNTNYYESLKPITEYVKKLCEFRTALDDFDNKDYDNLMLLMSMPGIKQVLYNTSIGNAGNTTVLASLLNKIKTKECNSDKWMEGK